MAFLNRDRRFIVLIVLVHLAACIETDIYLPAFPDMMDFFDTSEEMIQSILSWNFLGICISCPFYGPLSDSFGRRRLLIVALGLFLIGSIGTMFSNTIEQMLLFRVFQGLGSGGCFTVGAALIFDAFHAEKAIKVANDLNSIIPVIMAVAPMVGGWLNQSYGFRSNFILIAVFVLISFIICITSLEETLPPEKRKPFELREILDSFKRAMRTWAFWRPTFMICFVFAIYLSYVSNISILFVRHMGISSSFFPVYQATVLLSFVAATLMANKLIDWWGVETMKQRGLVLLYLGALGFIASSFLAPGSPNVFQFFMILFSFGAGWLMGPYFTEGMESLPDIKGITGSLMTSFRLLFTATVIGLTGAYFDGTIMPLAMVTAVIMVAITVTLMIKPKTA